MSSATFSNKFFFDDKLKDNIFNTISSNSINSFIISGPKGLGKANFIMNLSKFILCELENENSLNLSKLKQEVNFISNFGRDIEYYTGIVFEIFAGKKEIARGGRYDDLLKSLGAKKNIPAVGAAINLKNI